MHRLMIIGYLMITIGILISVYNSITFGEASPFGIPIIFVLSATISALGLTLIFQRKEEHVETNNN